MTVKVVYLNGYFEFVRNVENICTNNMWFVLILKNGTVKKLDRRLKLEVSYQGEDEKNEEIRKKRNCKMGRICNR